MEATLKAGALLQDGKYRIIQLLGHGGFGITYLAEQVALKRKVAIKEFFMKDCCERDSATSGVTVPTTSNRDLVKKFQSKFVREAQMIADIDHPNIVKVYDIFEQNGTAYYVMENLTGGSLQDKIVKNGPMNEKEATGYIRQVADALAYIHSRNTVHLDVKPSNILLNSSGRAVLIDFGISKHYDEDGEQTSSTPVGISKGYAPLEQSRSGDISQFTPATDIYALGATLYFLVTGKTPPEASIVYEDGLSRPAGITDTLWNAIEKAMQPRRKDRLQSVQEFVALLGGSGEAETIPIVEASTGIAGADAIENHQTKAESTDNTSIDAAPQKENDHTVLNSTTPTTKPKKEPKRKKSLWWIYAIAAAIVIAIIAVLALSGNEDESYDEDDDFASEATHEYVDLGLSVMWATCNVGADNPKEYGDYFAWGETETKDTFELSNYQWYDDYYNSLTKYTTGETDFTDYKTLLDSEDDVARVMWGRSWRTPTKAEWQELIDYCDWSWTDSGYLVIGPSGNSIFLPAAGYQNEGSTIWAGSEGYYWSSSLHIDYPSNAWYMHFGSLGYSMGSGPRCCGQSVRPVWGGTPATEPELAAIENEFDDSEFEEGLDVYAGGQVWEEEIIPMVDDDEMPPPPVEYDEAISPYADSEDDEEEVIPFALVEERPKFQGGDANDFSKWVNQRLVYPEVAKENGISGKVMLQFTVQKDGSLTDVKVFRSVDPSLDNEAIRVVKSSPKWTPGKQKGDPVAVTYTFPVIFQLR